MPDLADVRLLPFTGVFDEPNPKLWRSAKDVASETGTPGYYAVRLANGAVSCEVTATPRVGVYRFVWRPGARPRLLVDLQWVNALNADTAVTDFEASLGDDRRSISGGRRTKAWLTRQVYWRLAFGQPWASAEKLPRAPGEKGERYVLDFDLSGGAPLIVKAAMSTVDAAGAAANLAAEAPDWDFDAVRAAARDRWRALLGRIEAQGDAAQKTSFYTALYHLFLQPNDIADTDGRYRGGDARIHAARKGTYYTGLSLWDTFRAAHPFYTLVLPERVDGFVSSMLEHYKTMGFLPVIPYFGWETHCMIGNHAVPVIVDAYLKGFRGFDADLAFEAVTNSLTVTHVDPFGRPKIKENWDVYDRYGYYPYDLIRGESVSRTLECAYDDWCAARFAEARGRRAAAAFFDRRARNWTNVIDSVTGFARGRRTDGSWRTPFDPFATGHAQSRANDFTEANAFQYTWHVLHDPEGLVAHLGGRQAFGDRLDRLFRERDVIAADAPPDISGLIGQYVHGNEPSHHVAYLYQYAGRPRRTADVVREVTERFYRAAPDGLCGNDDCGQMSAWYVFAAMGFYPLNPCGGAYVLGAPQLPSVTLRLSSGRMFRTVARGLSRECPYVKSVTLNGRPVEGFILRHADIMAGGELVFEMGK